MAGFPQSDCSIRDVRRAGEIIAGNVAWTPETDAEIREAFRIANSWRDAHAFPMRSIRCALIFYMSRLDIKGITAARLKRMPAIRRKLGRIGLGLNQIQDLGGCRAILDTMGDVRTLVQILQQKSRHELRREDNYIEKPKDDGYRSHHIILGFKGNSVETSAFDGRRVELQLRTRMQHSWATAVEAVGLFRGEELKNHAGSQDWLRLFEAMSGEIAEAEGCPVHPRWADATKRRAEIRDLAGTLKALDFLEHVRQGVKGTDLPSSPGYAPSHYLIRFDHATKTVSVQPFNKAFQATQSYDEAESSQRGQESENIVLVEVSKLANLKAAYPNYFGDVGYFESQLQRVVRGQAAQEFSRVPVRQRPRKPEPAADPKWIGRNPFPHREPNLRKNREARERANKKA